jgi:hypothetical protein
MALFELSLWMLVTAYWLWRFIKFLRHFRANGQPAKALFFDSMLFIALLGYGFQIVPNACKVISWCQ